MYIVYDVYIYTYIHTHITGHSLRRPGFDQKRVLVSLRLLRLSLWYHTTNSLYKASKSKTLQAKFEIQLIVWIYTRRSWVMNFHFKKEGRLILLYLILEDVLCVLCNKISISYFWKVITILSDRLDILHSSKTLLLNFMDHTTYYELNSLKSN